LVLPLFMMSQVGGEGNNKPLQTTETTTDKGSIISTAVVVQGNGKPLPKTPSRPPTAGRKPLEKSPSSPNQSAPLVQDSTDKPVTTEVGQETDALTRVSSSNLSKRKGSDFSTSVGKLMSYRLSKGEESTSPREQLPVVVIPNKPKKDTPMVPPKPKKSQTSTTYTQN